MLNGFPVIFPASPIKFCCHLGLGLGVGTGFGSVLLWTSSLISLTDSTDSYSSDSGSETLMETLSYVKGVDRMVSPPFSNGNWVYTISEHGRKCESSYALEAWFAIPFAIIRGNLGSKVGLIRKCTNNNFCELEFKNQ